MRDIIFSDWVTSAYGSVSGGLLGRSSGLVPFKGRVQPKMIIGQEHIWTLRNKMVFIKIPETLLLVRERATYWSIVDHSIAKKKSL